MMNLFHSQSNRHLLPTLIWQKQTLRKNCSYLECFWSISSHIWTKYGDLWSKSPYSVRMRENTDQKNPKTNSFSQWEMIEVLLAIWCVMYVAKIDNNWKLFTIVVKSSILIVWQSSNAFLEALIFSKDLFWNPSKPGHFFTVFNKDLGYLEIDRKFFGISTSICITGTSIWSKMITQLLQNV